MTISTLTINDVSHKLADVYAQTVGEQILCTCRPPERPYSDEENELLGEDYVDGVALLFAKNGKFERVGLAGDWHGIIAMPPARNLDQAFSAEIMEELDLIEHVGNTHDGHQIAHFRVA